MKFRPLTLALSLALLIAPLESCGGKSSSSETDPDKAETSQPESQPASEKLKGSTIFIYMCGSNLETKQGLASKNIDELLSADVSDDFNIVIQTGGTKTWRHHDISNTEAQRYIIKDGELQLVESLDNKNMGDASTLTDFLTWGQQNYSAEKNMLVLWDHGGGAAKGVCFDENYGFDALTLSELHTALADAELDNKFDIIGFDACLMATIETADTVQDFADYMVASEEIEPSGGWDYKALAEDFEGENDNLEAGKKICDSFLEKCRANGKDTFASLAVFDLSKTDACIEKFSDFIDVLEANLGNRKFASFITESLDRTEQMGGDRTAQGGSNMIDMISFATRIALQIEDNVDYLWPAVYDLVPYSVTGEERFTCGMSFYYPEVYDKSEIESYTALDVCKAYNSYLDKYYLQVPASTISYTDMGSIADDGAFTVVLTPESDKYLSAVNFLLMTKDDKGVIHYICTDNDIKKDWESLTFKSNFRGISMALDGHRLFYSTVSTNDYFIKFTAPVKVNGKRTNLRFFFFKDEEYFNGGYYELFGTWEGYDENGLPSNEYFELQPGDKVQVVTDTVLENGKTTENWSDEFVIGDDCGTVAEIPLEDKTYQYAYVSTDIFGNNFVSDMATFEMQYTYDELLENPLPDDSYAAKVTGIEPYDP